MTKEPETVSTPGSPRPDRWGGPLAVIVLCSLLAILVSATSGHAHLPFTTDGKVGAYEWGTYGAGDRRVQVFFDSGYPDGSYRSAVRRAGGEWNRYQQSLQFEFQPGSITTDRTYGGDNHYCSRDRAPLHRNGRPASVIFWSALSPQTGGRVGSCWENGTQVGFRMAINRAPKVPWYRGSSGSVPDDRADLQSLATHEFGHATGWVRHYDGGSDDNLPGSEHCGRDMKDRQTMCALAAYPGQSRTRTLGQHDRHTFEAAY
jgi:hypothetical protein